MQQREKADVEQGSMPRDRREFPLGFQQNRNAPMYRPLGVTTPPDLLIPDKMNAWVLGDPDQLLLREKPTPVPARAEVLVRIDAVAICATDLEIIHSGSPASIQGGLSIWARLPRSDPMSTSSGSASASASKSMPAAANANVAVKACTLRA